MARNLNVSQVLTALPPQGYWPDILAETYSDATLKAPVGFRIMDTLGRVFRLCHVCENVTKGNVLTHLVTEAAVAATKFDADPIGATQLLVDVTLVANAYNDGLLGIEVGTAAGDLYPIVEHSAGTAGSADATIKIEGKLLTALSAADSVGFLINGPFRNLSQHNAANPCVEMPVGRAMATVVFATAPYLWVQTWGLALVKAGTGAVGAGDTVGLAEDDAGSVQTLVTTEDPAAIGVSLQAIADTEWGLVNLRCYP